MTEIEAVNLAKALEKTGIVQEIIYNKTEYEVADTLISALTKAKKKLNSLKKEQLDLWLEQTGKEAYSAADDALFFASIIIGWINGCSLEINMLKNAKRDYRRYTWTTVETFIRHLQGYDRLDIQRPKETNNSHDEEKTENIDDDDVINIFPDIFKK